MIPRFYVIEVVHAVGDLLDIIFENGDRIKLTLQAEDNYKMYSEVIIRCERYAAR